MVEVEHVKAHRTKKEKQETPQFERFVTEGNEKADELAKAGAMLDEGCRAEARAKSMQQEREEVCAAAASFPCLVENGETVKNSSQSQKKSGTSWIKQGRRRSIERRGALKQTSVDA